MKHKQLNKLLLTDWNPAFLQAGKFNSYINAYQKYTFVKTEDTANVEE